MYTVLCVALTLSVGLAPLQLVLPPTIAAEPLSTGNSSLTSDWATPIDDSNHQTRTACDGQTLSIVCAVGRTIRLGYAQWGRGSWTVCRNYSGPSQSQLQRPRRGDVESDESVGDSDNGDGLPCYSTKALQIVSDRCNGSQTCSLPAVAATFRHSGTCAEGISSYLEVQFYCEPVNVPMPIPLPAQMSNLPSNVPGHLAAQQAPSLPVSSSSCPSKVERGLTWPATPAGQWAYVGCPGVQTTPASAIVRTAGWQCGVRPVAWIGHPNLKNCSCSSVSSMHQMMKTSKNLLEPAVVQAATSGLRQVLQSSQTLYGGDVDAMVDVVDVVVGQVDVEMDNNMKDMATFGSTVRSVFASALDTGNGLLQERHRESWRDMAPRERQRTASKILRFVESSAFQYAESMNLSAGQTSLNVTDNIALEVGALTPGRMWQSIRQERLAGTRWGSVRNSVSLPSGAVSGLTRAGKTKIVFGMFNNIDVWMSPAAAAAAAAQLGMGATESNGCNSSIADVSNCSREQTVNSGIITVSVGRRKSRSTPLSEPIRLVLEHKTENMSSPKCVYWNFSNSSESGGEWSTVGCRLVFSNKTHTTCECDHLTSFAILMSPTAPVLSEADALALSIITYIGCIISLVCLCLAFLTFQFCRSIQGDRNTVHKNLVINLFVANALFIIGATVYQIPTLCSVVAGFLHYFLLTSFAWMLLEGIQLYVMLVEVFEAEKSRIKWYYLAAYGAPAVIVGISAAVYHEGYGTPSYCWLTVERGFIWAFIAPVIAVIVVNAAMLGVALRAMYQHTKLAASWRKEKTKLQQMRSWVKGAVVLEVLLGLTWVFGLSFVNAETVAFAYIFTILNTLQGTFIFAFHCLMNEKVRLDYQRMIRHSRCLPASFRMRFGGGRSSMSTMPKESNSSGGGNYLSRLLPPRRRHSSSSTSLSKSNSTATRKSAAMVANDQTPAARTVSPPLASDSGFDDPSSYLEPTGIRLGDSEFQMNDRDASVMEGSVADTDYFVRLTQPGGNHGKPSQSHAVATSRITEEGSSLTQNTSDVLSVETEDSGSFMDDEQTNNRSNRKSDRKLRPKNVSKPSSMPPSSDQPSSSSGIKSRVASANDSSANSSSSASVTTSEKTKKQSDKIAGDVSTDLEYDASQSDSYEPAARVFVGKVTAC